jgi:hypothetical protein
VEVGVQIDMKREKGVIDVEGAADRRRAMGGGEMQTRRQNMQNKTFGWVMKRG